MGTSPKLELKYSTHLSANSVAHGLHIVWKQTKVPSLSKITNPGLKNPDSNFASLAEGDMVEYFLAFILWRKASLLAVFVAATFLETCKRPKNMEKKTLIQGL